jgi:predicted transglutaminase-like cysteine proteinase
LKWVVSTILLLLAALCLPDKFAAMGSAPENSAAMETAQAIDMQSAQTLERAQNGAAERTQEKQALPEQPPQQANAGGQETPPILAQAENQPPWRQGSSSVAAPRPAQAAPARKPSQPVWRQGAESSPEDMGEENAQAGGPNRLFQSKAFRGNFNALPKWKRVLSKVKAEIQELNSCTSAKTCPPGATSWKRIMEQAKGKQGLEQLKMVNSFFNKWPYRLDKDAYGTSDWWATPKEFLKISGDCEDYAIIKYFALRELGYAKDDLRIVVVKDRIRGIAHAVLAVFLQDSAHILNNISDAIYTDVKYRHYIPQYSLNEEHRWSHIPVSN